jgi:predicted DsbA family dithiol-disulfide isomerase
MPKEKKLQFSNALFIIASLAALLVMVLLSSYMGFLGRVRKDIKNTNIEDRYYLNEEFADNDPLITRVPDLEDMLTGPIISSLDPVQGDKKAPVVIVEFSDYECSYCQEVEQHLKELTARYKYQVRLIWKDYPKTNTDSASFKAAIAGRCAQAQDSFWQYHDLLYEFGKLNTETFLNIAEILELDITDFKACLDSTGPKDLVRDNIEEANALGIAGIPFIYINDQEVLGEISLEELERIIKIELAKVKQ